MEYKPSTLQIRNDKNRKVYYVWVTVPESIRAMLGNRKQLKKSTGTTDILVAKERQRDIEAELYKQMDDAQLNEHPLVKSANALHDALLNMPNSKENYKWSAAQWFDEEARWEAEDDLRLRSGQVLNLDPDSMGDIEEMQVVSRIQSNVEPLYWDWITEFRKVYAESARPKKRAKPFTTIMEECFKSAKFRAVRWNSEKTADEYEAKIKVFSQWLGNRSWEEAIRHKVGTDFIMELASPESKIQSGGYANSTIVKYKSALSHIWNYLRDQEYISEETTPWSRVSTDKVGKKEKARKSFSHDLLLKMFSLEVSDEDKLMLTLLITTGCRFEEIAQLQWKHIKTWEDNETNYIDLTTEELQLKNENSARRVPLIRAVETILLPRRSEDPNKKIFSYHTNHYGKHGDDNKRLGRWLRREVTDDKQLPLHSLRHTFKTLFRNASEFHEIGEFIMGHRGFGGQSSKYGEAPTVDRMKIEINKIDFSFLEMPRLTDERG